MKVLAPRETLHQNLAAISGVVSPHTSLPILSNVLVQATQGSVVLTATDLDVTVKVACEVDVREEGTLTVPARKFQDVLRELPDETIRLEKQDSRLVIESGKNHFEIHALPEEDYPVAPRVQEDAGIRIRAELVRDWADLLLFAVSKDESRPVLGGVLWEIDERGFTMVATNGHRLSLLTHPGKFRKIAGLDDLIIPPKAMHLLMRLSAPDEEIELIPGENHLLFKGGEYEIYSRLLEGPYPNYQQVIPKDNDKVAILNRQELLGAVRRTSLLANVATKRIELGFEKSVLRVAVNTRDVGKALCEIDADYNGEEVRLDFNAGYLEDVLKVLRSEKVRVSFKGPDRAALIGPEGQEDAEEYICLIMPLRVMETA
jgi:DNA polymerase-3 subunit beta